MKVLDNQQFNIDKVKETYGERKYNDVIISSPYDIGDKVKIVMPKGVYYPKFEFYDNEWSKHNEWYISYIEVHIKFEDNEYKYKRIYELYSEETNNYGFRYYIKDIEEQFLISIEESHPISFIFTCPFNFKEDIWCYNLHYKTITPIKFKFEYITYIKESFFDRNGNISIKGNFVSLSGRNYDSYRINKEDDRHNGIKLSNYSNNHSLYTFVGQDRNLYSIEDIKKEVDIHNFVKETYRHCVNSYFSGIFCEEFIKDYGLSNEELEEILNSKKKKITTKKKVSTSKSKVKSIVEGLSEKEKKELLKILSQ